MKSMIANKAEIFERILSKYELPLKGIHGPSHWARVALYGQSICTRTVDLKVVELFAMLHDSCRRTDGYCKEHGNEAADFVRELHSDGVLGLDEEQLGALASAVGGHVGGRIPVSETVAVCWDADRLDLGRVGMSTKKEYMSTAIGRLIAEERCEESGMDYTYNWRCWYQMFPVDMISAWPELHEAWKQ